MGAYCCNSLIQTDTKTLPNQFGKRALHRPEMHGAFSTHLLQPGTASPTAAFSSGVASQ
ncbi:hypothetical protein SAMN05216345_11122 [Cupriavidus sp. YR651]|nr:hypothetical protein SAMN05216345_11122 [Cupriavidus sp. YR651]